MFEISNKFWWWPGFPLLLSESGSGKLRLPGGWLLDKQVFMAGERINMSGSRVGTSGFSASLNHHS